MTKKNYSREWFMWWANDAKTANNFVKNSLYGQLEKVVLRYSFSTTTEGKNYANDGLCKTDY
jgi:hypothetical protein